ncbi:uncharacterized protein Z518_09406 [Rhinocladiella mackenziei CBS 650.93]|uniref:Rhinocladiella mackenziei CBS 650.93 unplaced genomic scaffold supercont1.7, whole genome shotgun sequence n=1 Tax=Rhinocladiella mackenziei CBS 650.93 TaxID=1442369 RepID=A0A0D2IYJ3_9EURO|nr:uncharacterized protein Z518_09406 [Rhinocladiella mackenziei CBS 650.93]KIX01680.1 hypothetical protein Z518_09406 [Rhinocladiella mackenziei CBS 650.93]
MARGLRRACAVAGFCLIQSIAGMVVTAPPRALEPRSTGTPTSSNIACGWASSASSAYLAAKPEATGVIIDAELAYECLKSVPNYQEPAMDLLNSLRTFLEFQSTKEYLRDPPSGFLFPALDLDLEWDNIQKKVEGGEYESEYDMQIDIVSLLNSARDGHLHWEGDVVGAFTFIRNIGNGLAAVSSDGEQTPQVYLVDDLITIDSESQKVLPVTSYTPSPVESIDGVDVVSFLLTQSLDARSQDPDALWNQLFFSLGRPSYQTFQIPTYYPGTSTNITLANGTTREYPNVATVNVPLDGLATGDDAYSAFCPGAFESVTAIPSSSAAATSTSASPSAPTIPGYPYPVIKHSAGSVAGYYLNDTGFTDVAVLQVREFQSATDISLDYEREFQTVVQKFLDAAVRTGKRKLIIDLQGNSGGLVDLGTDLFAQLFPSIPPNSKSNMRDNLGFYILGSIASNNITDAEKTSDEDLAENLYVPLAYQTVVDPDMRHYPDFQSFYGPYEVYGGKFSAFFQNNYTDPNSSDFAGQGIIITGTNNRTGFRQPFAPQDIVVLLDGLCASTCTVFSEYLKSYANVQFITVGGRPQTGPMQAVGGVKGVQVFPFDTTITPWWVDLYQSPQNTLMDLANGSIWENFTYLPVLREFRYAGGGVNGRNHFRIGDKTETPLQFVYEAADCRMWWTREMLYDPTFLWARVANMAFQERRGTQFNSKYCVKDSTGHPTSISGGWKKGTLGPQTPPKNANATVQGWKLEGTPLGPTSSDQLNTTSTETGTVIENNALADTVADSPELTSFKEACTSYTGDAWLVKLMCGALGT